MTLSKDEVYWRNQLKGMFVARTLRSLVRRALRCLFGFLAGSFHRRVAGFFGFRAPFAFISNFLQRVMREMFDADKGIMRRANPNELVQFDLDSRPMPAREGPMQCASSPLRQTISKL